MFLLTLPVFAGPEGQFLRIYFLQDPWIKPFWKGPVSCHFPCFAGAGFDPLGRGRQVLPFGRSSRISKSAVCWTRRFFTRWAAAAITWPTPTGEQPARTCYAWLPPSTVTASPRSPAPAGPARG